jgi:hypothetical protein
LNNQRAWVPGATIAVVATACALAVIAVPAVSAQRATSERRVFATVLNPDDTPVTALTAADFVLRENDVAREVITAEPAGPPDYLVLLVDDSQASADLIMELRDGVKAFVNRMAGSAPVPAMRLTTFGDRPTKLVEFTKTPSLLTAAIDRMFPRPGSGSTLLEAIVETTRDLRTRSAERPAIVVFLNETSPEYSEDRHARVSDVLRGARASLWTLVLQSRRGPDMSDSGRERSIVIGDVTKRSGGFNKFLLSKLGIEPGFATLADALRSQYVLTYRRPDSLIPPERLEVTTRQPNVRVLAPSWTVP